MPICYILLIDKKNNNNNSKNPNPIANTATHAAKLQNRQTRQEQLFSLIVAKKINGIKTKSK
jgi:hypothetical protein